MSREIKFRFRVQIPAGFDDKGERVEYVHQTLDQLMEPHILLNHSMITVLSRAEWTGLVDKNGVEIYEGDVVRTDHNSGAAFGASLHDGEVQYQRAAFIIRNGIIAQSLAALSGNKWSLEVIGNIHENPELLTTKEVI